MKRSFITTYRLIFGFAAILAVYSCSDEFFEKQAGDRITPEQHYKSLDDAEVSLSGIMVTLQDYMPRLVLVDGLLTDQLDVTANADANLVAVNEHDIIAGNPFTDPADLYKVIINVNEVIQYVDTIKDKELNEFVKFYVKGGLIGMRSWAYFTLVRYYGEAAWISDNLTSLPGDMQQKILKKDEMIDTLINQLKPYIHDSRKDQQFEEVRLGGYVNTKALLGEMYLEKDEFDSAVVFLKMACESYENPNTLYKVDKAYTKESWKNIFVGAQNAQTENISVIPFASTQGQYNPLPQWMMYSDLYMVKPTQMVIDSFMMQTQLNGLPGDLFRGLGFTIDTADNGEYYVSKYNIDESEPYSSDIILSRAADLHLLLAEALNRAGDSETALRLLNDGFAALAVKPPAYIRWNNNLGVRGRAYVANRPVDLTRPDLIEYVEDLILAERAMELAYEGKRYTDLIRVAHRRGTPEYLADKVSAKFADPTKRAAIRTMLMTEVNWYLKY